MQIECGISGHQVAVGGNRLGLWPTATRWCWHSADNTLAFLGPLQES